MRSKSSALRSSQPPPTLALEEVEVGVKDGGQHRDLVLWGGVAREDDGELVRLVDEVTAPLLHLDQLAFLSAGLGIFHAEAVGETWALGAEGLGAAVLEVADSEPERGASGVAAGPRVGVPGTPHGWEGAWRGGSGHPPPESS